MLLSFLHLRNSQFRKKQPMYQHCKVTAYLTMFQRFNLNFILCKQLTNKKLTPDQKQKKTKKKHTKNNHTKKTNQVQLHIASSGLVALS